MPKRLPEDQPKPRPIIIPDDIIQKCKLILQTPEVTVPYLKNWLKEKDQLTTGSKRPLCEWVIQTYEAANGPVNLGTAPPVGGNLSFSAAAVIDIDEDYDDEDEDQAV